MVDLSYKNIRKLQNCISIAELEYGDNFPWKWENLEIQTDEEGIYVYVPQGSYLGNTTINLSDTYEDSGNDCFLVETALKYFKPLLEEVLKLREAYNHKPSYLTTRDNY